MTAVEKTRQLIDELIEHLNQHPYSMGLDRVVNLLRAIDGAMVDADWKELNWMPVTLESVASDLVLAEQSAQVDQEDEERYLEKKLAAFRAAGF